MNRLLHLITPFSSDEFGEMGINPLTLSFRNGREKEFLDDYTRQSVIQVRFALATGALLYSLFALLDLRLAQSALPHVLLIRFGIVLPFCLLMMALTFVLPAGRHLQAMIAACALVAGTGIIEMIRVIPPGAAEDYYAGLILVFMFIAAFGRIRFIWAAATVLMLLVLFEATVHLFTGIPRVEHQNNDFFLFSAALISLVTSYTLELYARRGYYLNRLVAIEHRNTAALNRDLEARIRERTEALTAANEELRHEMEIRRRSVEALRESEKQYRTLFETFLVPIIFTGPDLRITVINKAGRRLFKYGDDSLIGGPLEKLFHDRLDCSRLRNELNRATDIRNFNVAMADAEGARIECMLSTAVRRGDDGGILHYQLFINDITEHRRLERQFFQAQKMESVGRLAGGLAHDFNNLLTVIIGNAEIAEMLADGNDQITEHIHEIKLSSERAANLTRQLLTFSRHQVFDPRVVSANDILLNMDRMLRRLIGEDVELVTLLEESLWRVKIDPGQIEQVLTNIVVNARDAMPGGGKVTIETANVTLDEEFIATHHDLTPGDYIMIAVTDSGIGMSKDIASRIFEPFFTTKEKGRGTGLGLSTCYGIIHRHGGHILVHSRKDHGSTFVIYLPRVVGEEAPEPPKPSDTGLTSGTETLLVAEDESAVRAMLGRALGDAGYQVIEASNGEEALKKGRAHGFRKIDLLVTDMVMPRMGGRELSERMLAEHPGIRILYISGYTNDSMVRRRVRDGQSAFLQKPFTPATVVQKVRELLDAPVAEAPDGLSA